jgi:hypothetical protein
MQRPARASDWSLTIPIWGPRDAKGGEKMGATAKDTKTLSSQTGFNGREAAEARKIGMRRKLK